MKSTHFTSGQPIREPYAPPQLVRFSTFYHNHKLKLFATSYYLYTSYFRSNYNRKFNTNLNPDFYSRFVRFLALIYTVNLIDMTKVFNRRLKNLNVFTRRAHPTTAVG
jgi:hypothetical protein